MAGKNPFGRMRDIDDPYAVYRAGDWEWRVLKTYQHPDKERENRNAVWLCGVKSPFTFGSFEFGDTYVRDVLGVLAERTDEWDVLGLHSQSYAEWVEHYTQSGPMSRTLYPEW